MLPLVGARLLGGIRRLRGSWPGLQLGQPGIPPAPADIVVKLLKENGFDKVKLFEAEAEPLKALGNSGIQVMVGIPNDMLAGLASSVQAAVNWVLANVSTYISKYGTDIRYGSSCGQLDSKSNASYAFNMYYQMMDQRRGTCSFNNLSVVTAIDPSRGSCWFEVMIDTGKHEAAPSPKTSSSRGTKFNLGMAFIIILALMISG